MSATQGWYGVRTVLAHSGSSQNATNQLYEERIVIVRASSVDEAIARVEADSRSIASDVGAMHLEFAQAFALFDDEPSDLSEVFSLMRDSELAPGQYIDRFFATGCERTR